MSISQHGTSVLFTSHSKDRRFTKVSVPSQGSQRSCMCLLGVYFDSRSISLMASVPCTGNYTPEIIHRKPIHGLQKIGCAVIWNYFRLLMLKVVPDISRPKKSRHYFDALNEREHWQIIFRFASIHVRACFNRRKEHPYIVLQYTPKSTQK